MSLPSSIDKSLSIEKSLDDAFTWPSIFSDLVPGSCLKLFNLYKHVPEFQTVLKKLLSNDTSTTAVPKELIELFTNFSLELEEHTFSKQSSQIIIKPKADASSANSQIISADSQIIFASPTFVTTQEFDYYFEKILTKLALLGSARQNVMVDNSPNDPTADIVKLSDLKLTKSPTKLTATTTATIAPTKSTAIAPLVVSTTLQIPIPMVNCLLINWEHRKRFTIQDEIYNITPLKTESKQIQDLKMDILDCLNFEKSKSVKNAKLKDSLIEKILKMSDLIKSINSTTQTDKLNETKFDFYWDFHLSALGYFDSTINIGYNLLRNTSDESDRTAGLEMLRSIKEEPFAKEAKDIIDEFIQDLQAGQPTNVKDMVSCMIGQMDQLALSGKITDHPNLLQIYNLIKTSPLS